MVDLLEQCAKFLERAERYEVMGEVFKLAIPVYEQERDFLVSEYLPLHLNSSVKSSGDYAQGLCGKRAFPLLVW